MKNFGKILMGLSLVLLLGCSNKDSVPAKAIQAGDKAPDFSLPDASGHFMKLSDVQSGTWLVLVFYRGAWCHSCMNQLLDLKKDIQKFTDLHVALAAVSVDTIEDSSTFNNQWRFPFPLLSDTQFRLIDAYGARDIGGGNQKQDISRRSVVIIDPQKIVRYTHIGKEPGDWLDTDELLYNIQKVQSTVNAKP
jgi:peroxiredoxin